MKCEESIVEMNRRLIERAKSSSHWFSELINEMITTPDSPLTPEFIDEMIVSSDHQCTPECNFDNVTEALAELESIYPEIFQGHST